MPLKAKFTNLEARAILATRAKVPAALELFRPLPHQEEFFLTMSMDLILEVMLGGGNRCLHESQEIYDPVTKKSTPVSQIDRDFHVWSIDPATGVRTIAKATEPFAKAIDDFYTVSLSNGQSFVVTLGHQVLSADGVWSEIGALRESLPFPLASTSDTFLSGFQRDVRRCEKTTASLRSCCSAYSRRDGERLPSAEDTARDALPSQGGAQEQFFGACDEMDESGNRPPCNHPYLLGGRPSIQDVSLLAAVRFGASESRVSSRPYSRASAIQDVAESWQDGLRSAEELDHRFRTRFASDLPATEIVSPSRVSPTNVYVTSVEYHSTGIVWDIEVAGVNNYCLSGVLHHNSGKSVSASAALASLILNQPITFRDGRKIHMRPERWRKEGLKIWIVGFDWDHIGKTIYRLLFEPDPFRMIQDRETGKWRGWDPLREGEPPHEATRPAPALIPIEAIKGGEEGISWENKKEHQPNSLTLLHDDTRVQFFPSTANSPPMGDPAHIIWIDEHINSESWYSELIVRLRDYRGRLLWTAWAGIVTSVNIMEARERAERDAGKPNCKTFAFTFSGEDNPIGDKEHDEAIYGTMDDETRQARAQGVANYSRWLVFARFSRHIHRALPGDPRDDDPLAAEIRKHNGIPGDWTRYMILDPGTQHAAVLFVAVPPPKLWATAGDYIVPYDEFYVPRTGAQAIAQAVSKRCEGVVIEDIIADSHACRQTPLGFSLTVGQNYEKEFTAVGFGSRRHGARMSYGSDDVDSRILKAQGTFNIRGDGTVRLRILGCEQLCRQLQRYRWEQGADGNPMNRPAKYQKIDLCHTFEYFVSRDDCGYFKPPVIQKVTPDYYANATSSINAIFGRTNAVKSEDRTVYLGAGRPT